MDESARWKQVKDVWMRVCEAPEAEQRAALDEACAGDEDLRRRVVALMQADSKAGAFLATPALGAAPAMADDAPGPSAGERVGAWRLIERIGEGGMGEVWRAERDDGAYTQTAAVKFVRRSAGRMSGVLERFEQERQVLARLDHPSIARLLDGGEAPWGDPFLVMEYVDGSPLHEHCERSGLSVDERLALFVQVCDAVQHAHQSLVVHRDLKPANILVDATGRPRLLDFGIAKVLDPDDAGARDVASTWIVTPRYGSPEQLRGGPITTATDVYALGVILYELLTDRAPFDLHDKTPAEIERLVCQTDPPPLNAPGPRSTTRRLRGDLEWIVRRAMAKLPEERYTSAAALGDDVRRCLDGRTVSARAPTSMYRLRTFVRRHRVGVTAAALVAIALIGATIVSATSLVREADQRRRAEAERAVAQSINEFLVRALSAANPRVARGDDVTVRELLDETALEIETAFADQPLVEAGVRLAIGGTYRSLGVYDEAERHLRRAMELRRATLGDVSVEHAEVLAALGSLLSEHDRGDEAEPLVRRALEIREAAGDEAAIIDSLLRVGAVERRLGQSAEAVETHQRAVARARAHFASPSQPLVEAIDELGVSLFSARRDEEARAVAEESIAMHEALGDPEGPAALLAMENLAISLRRAGRATEAEPIFEKALPAMRRVFGPDHPETLLTCNNYASLLMSLDRHDEAETLLVDSIARVDAAPNKRGGNLATMLDNLAMLYEDTGRPEDAEPCYRRALGIFEEIYGPEHPDTVIAKHNFGGYLRTHGRAADAMPLLEAAAGAAPATFGEASWLTAHFRGGLGACLGLLGRFEEAEALLLKSESGVRAALGDTDARTRTACDRLARMYEAWEGHEEMAASWRAKVAEIDGASAPAGGE